ncbi:phosphatase PAP2 family protein [Pedococcus sp. 5OH_020]|uniref:phosphatase PAP2 family protein n=1 Tax=Pedococcus sp. 5OH_020 TaxID=2989814 RepID=UPI0022E9F058|nr:phosphatase PAP2 family protein [Pedococcus sp. 5OH_020]
MVLFAVPVVLLAFAARQKFEPLVRLDDRLTLAATDATRRTGAKAGLILLQQVSQPVRIYVLAVLVAAWAWRFCNLRTRALWAIVTMMVAWNLGLDAKLVVQRARPVLHEPISHAPGYSFPSGHAFNITVIATVMVFMLWPLLSSVGRRVAVVLAVLASLAVGLDRVFLGVHFPSDVVAGWVLGVGITFSSWLGFVGGTVPTAGTTGRDRTTSRAAASLSGRPSRVVRQDAQDLLVRVVAPGAALWTVIVALGVMLGGPLLWLSRDEEAFSKDLARERTPTWNGITLVWSHVGNTEIIISVCVVVMAVLLWRTHDWRLSVVPGIAIALQATIFVIATNLVDRGRPQVPKLDPAPPTSSYPSGHVGAAFALYLSFALLLLARKRTPLRRLTSVLCLMVPLLVAYARLYRGMHHLTDVVVGLANGVLCALLAYGWYRRRQHATFVAHAHTPRAVP